MSTRFGGRTVAMVAGAVLLFAGAAAADDPQPNPLPWKHGPTTAGIGDLAELDLSDSFVFLDADGTRRLMELTQNPVSGNELATVSSAAKDQNWFVVFEFEPTGYVKDDERNDLDADAMLASIRKGTEASNEERRKHGWGTMEIVGWHEAPHYDAQTNNLSWAVIAKSSEGGQTVNRMIKLLGRRGVMTATLVASPEELVAAIPLVDGLIEGYRYKPGHTYAEFVPSTDKLAEYGLTALVVGGAGAALVKSGLLVKLWKPIVVGLVALGAGVKRLLFGGRKAHDSVEGSVG